MTDDRPPTLKESWQDLEHHLSLTMTHAAQRFRDLADSAGELRNE